MNAFWLQSRRSRGPVKMQGFELATIFVAPADFQNFWETDSRKLVGLFGGPTRCFTIPPSHAVWAPRGPEASRNLIWDLSRPHLGISGGLFARWQGDEATASFYFHIYGFTMDLRRSIPAAMTSSLLGGARIAQSWLTASDFHASFPSAGCKAPPCPLCNTTAVPDVHAHCAIPRRSQMVAVVVLLPRRIDQCKKMEVF